MNRSSRSLAFFVLLAFAAWAGFALAGGVPSKGGHSQAAPAQKRTGEGAGHSHERCELHGGAVSMTEAHHFETLFSPDGVRIYMYSGAQAPMMITKSVSGSVTFVRADGTTQEVPLVAEVPKEGEKAVYFCPMHNVVQTTPGTCPQCGGMTLYTQNRLYGKADLSKADPRSVKAIIHITGLKGDEKEVTFTEKNAPPGQESGTPIPDKG
jgi:hypothetical protein